MPSVYGPDCDRCGHFADWHHLNPEGRFGCIGCACSNYVGVLSAEAPGESRGEAGAPELTPAETFHPGEYVDDELAARGIPPRMLRKLSRLLIARDEVTGLLECAVAVDERIAQGLAYAFGTGAEIWLKLQRAYDQGAQLGGSRDDA